ncbi:helix-turn-helix transcriptional regulator [Clostridium sp. YIM B02515]|uniref:Helix-turn-helix transcriptional regulator n=1 Tax=Clostridium rhizosphaerae TaxID=2803861 RepID=A0ABS1T6I1_9CLOT|nr:helix-turn-helix transcriptional regulator [Clostridium rhizosphaerae]
MSRDLCELKEIDEKVKNELRNIKSNPKASFEDNNKVKALKNNIYEKVSKTFVYNLRRLIMLEATQKKLAKKIGVSEDLLSKYKSGEAFPSIETLLYICEVYNISLEELLSTPLTAGDIESMATNNISEPNIFEDKYYAYFLVTNIAKEGAIHEGIIEFNNDAVVFKILARGSVVKYFKGNCNASEKLIDFNLNSQSDGAAYISMIKPNINKNKYLGGLAILVLPSDANSKPCVQKILFSRVRLDREMYYDNLKDLLKFNTEELSRGSIKLSQWEDETAYNFLQKLI